MPTAGSDKDTLPAAKRKTKSPKVATPVCSLEKQADSNVNRMPRPMCLLEPNWGPCGVTVTNQLQAAWGFWGTTVGTEGKEPNKTLKKERGNLGSQACRPQHEGLTPLGVCLWTWEAFCVQTLRPRGGNCPSPQGLLRWQGLWSSLLSRGCLGLSGFLLVSGQSERRDKQEQHCLRDSRKTEDVLLSEHKATLTQPFCSCGPACPECQVGGLKGGPTLRLPCATHRIH